MTDGTQAITAVHFAALGILAVLVVIGILAGIRAKRRRVEAEREVVAHAEEAGVEPAPPAEPQSVESAVAPVADRTATAAPAEAASPYRPLADEPIAAAIAPDGTTATIAADAADAPEPTSPADAPLTQLKGLGPKVAQRLGELGIDRVGQLAAVDDAEAARLDAELGPFAGRMARDRWVEQARLLAADDRDGFERVFGKL